jgi:hypothetical protein
MICQWFALKITGTVFSILTSEPVATVFSCLASKPVATVFLDLASKPVATVFLDLASKPVAMVFSNLASKPVATVSLGLTSKPVLGFLVEPQNQGGGGFSDLGIKIGSYGFLLWASKPSRLRFICCVIKPMGG